MAQIIYGIHPVQEALKSSHLQIEKILIGTQTLHPPLQSILDLANKRKIPVTFTTKESLERMTKGGVHQNVAGLVKETPYADLGDILSLWKKEGTKLALSHPRRDPGSTEFWIPHSDGSGMWSPWDHHSERSVCRNHFGRDQGFCRSGCPFAHCQSRQYCCHDRSLKKRRDLGLWRLRRGRRI